MGMNSAISWTDSTFNPWWGCEKVSPACTHCYAETFSKRVGFSVWGGQTERRLFGDKHWNEPVLWNAKAEKAEAKMRVFCASMSDVFESRSDLDEQRERLWRLIAVTPWLDWMLLTKRPENMLDMTPAKWERGWPANVWAGTTTENQEWLDKRLPLLKIVPAEVRWLSVEPMLGPVKLGRWAKHVHWVIVGGESGWGARPMKVEWVMNLLDECRQHDIAYHFKQKGEILARELGCKDRAGKDSSEWPEEFKVQEFPRTREFRAA